VSFFEKFFIIFIVIYDCRRHFLSFANLNRNAVAKNKIMNTSVFSHFPQLCTGQASPLLRSCEQWIRGWILPLRPLCLLPVKTKRLEFRVNKRKIYNILTKMARGYPTLTPLRHFEVSMLWVNNFIFVKKFYEFFWQPKVQRTWERVIKFVCYKLLTRQSGQRRCLENIIQMNLKIHD